MRCMRDGARRASTQPEILHLALQHGARQAEHLRGVRDVAAVTSQHASDVTRLELRARLAQGAIVEGQRFAHVAFGLVQLCKTMPLQ